MAAIVKEGSQDFEIAFLDRSFGGRETTALVVDGNTGELQVKKALSLPDGAIGGQAIAAAAFKQIGPVDGHNGAGAITATGAKVGDKVIYAVNITDGSAPAVESTVTVADQIQQTDAADLSLKKLSFILVRG